MPNLIIHHSVAWKAAATKYHFLSVEPPTTWPVLVGFPQTDGTPVPVVVMTVDMAVKMLSDCTSDRLAQVHTTIMSKLTAVLPKQSQPKTGMLIGGIGGIGMNGEVKTPETEEASYTAVHQDSGEKVTLSGFLTPAQFKVGQVINFNGQKYVITGSDTVIQGIDPIDGTEGTLIIAEDSPSIPGMEEIPMDPSKYDKPNVAESQDPTEHVLDVERNV